MKNKQNTKGKEDSLAFASLMEEVEKSRKKAKVFYISGLVLVVLAVFSFLLFGPVTVPVFSELGDKILDNTEFVEEDQELEEDTPEFTEKEEEPKEETKTTIKTYTNTPTPTTPTVDTGAQYDTCIQDCDNTYNSAITSTNSKYTSAQEICDNQYDTDVAYCKTTRDDEIAYCGAGYFEEGFLSAEGFDECMDKQKEKYDKCMSTAYDSTYMSCYNTANSNHDRNTDLALSDKTLCYSKCGNRY
jgi:hypothetical protein